MGKVFIKELSAKEFFQELEADSDAVLIDVRTQIEYDASHIVNSMLIDIKQRSFVDEVAELDPQKSYYVYCRIAIRSANACRYMQQQGFKRVCHLKGGIEAINQDLKEKYIQ